MRLLSDWSRDKVGSDVDTSHSKRDWVYAGISHPAKIVIARASASRRLAPGAKVVLVGDEHAAGIGQFLGRLCMDSKVNCRFEWERGLALENWATADRIQKLKDSKPSLVVASFRPKSTDPQTVASKLKELLKIMGSVPVAWVLPLEKSNQAETLAIALSAVGIPAFHSESIEVHRSQTGAPSARGYAGWAGAIWCWIR